MFNARLALRESSIHQSVGGLDWRSASFFGYSLDFDPFKEVRPLWFSCPFDGMERVRVPNWNICHTSNFTVEISTEKSPFYSNGRVSARIRDGEKTLLLQIFVSEENFNRIIENCGKFSSFRIAFDVETETDFLSTEGNVIRFAKLKADPSENGLRNYTLQWEMNQEKAG